MQTSSFNGTYPYSFSELAHMQNTPEDAVRLARLRYHLETSDYFAFLATIFGIIEEGLLSKPADVDQELALVRSMRKDLLFLQDGYHIEPAPTEA